MAALALARTGRKVTLVGPAVATNDQRTTALMRPALDFLSHIGVLSALESAAAPLKTMRIVDATERLVRSPTVTFRAAEIGEKYFGLNVPNALMLRELEAAVRANPAIVWHESTVVQWSPDEDAVHAVLANGEHISASLVVAADGRMSLAREAAGIRISTRRQPQSALVVTFVHSRPHHSISTEFHTASGPFTQVPLPGLRSSLVWVVSPQTAADLMVLDDAELSIKVEERMQSMLGRVEVEPGRQVYPLTSTVPTAFARNRIALVGEAAHQFPPIGAQGLNLGVRDVEELVKVVAGRADPGSPAALADYDRRRRPDVLVRSMGVNLLNGSLLSEMLPAQLARGAGLSLLQRLSPLRAFVMREGLAPGSGLPGAVADLRKQVRRERPALDQEQQRRDGADR
jgi:2-octaprenyl-6-methoxyphenol hydroxylase